MSYQNAEIIAVGSELLTPQRIDTNSLFLTGQLNTLGVEVVAKTVIGDHRERLASAVREATSRVPILIVTGGLGPTEDDVTRDATAAALERRLIFSEDICDSIVRRFARLGRKMAEINRRQAFLVEGASPLLNPNGTAPGQWIEHAGGVVALLPGPPEELQPMFAQQCVPRLEKILPPQVIRTRLLRVALLPESEVDQRISPVYTRYENPATTILAAPGDIQVHFCARSRTEDEAEALLTEVVSQIEPLLGDRVYSRDGSSLEETVGARLRALAQTVSVAESCTGGMLAERITSVPGSSGYFLGGFLVYTDRIKAELLGVDPALIERHTAVSPQVAEALAVAARQRTGSTYALSVTGVAGPSGGSEATPVGTVFIGIAAPASVRVRPARFLGDRTRVRTLAVQTALDCLRIALQ